MLKRSLMEGSCWVGEHAVYRYCEQIVTPQQGSLWFVLEICLERVPSWGQRSTQISIPHDQAWEDSPESVQKPTQNPDAELNILI